MATATRTHCWHSTAVTGKVLPTGNLELLLYRATNGNRLRSSIVGNLNFARLKASSFVRYSTPRERSLA